MANISCDDLDFVCEECYQVIYDDCEDITVDLGLTALTSYCVKFYDKFGNTFSQTVTTNAQGAFEIDQSELPDNFFNPYSGKIEIQIFANCDTSTRVSFTAAYLSFSCLLLINSESVEADEDISVSGNSYVTVTDGNNTYYIKCGETYTCLGEDCEDATVRNSDSSYNTTVASGATLVLPDISFTDSNLVVTQVASAKNIVATPQVKSLFLKSIFATGDDEMGSITIDADNAGTYTSISDDGGSGAITLNINSGGHAAFVNPTTLSIGDTLVIKRVTTTSAGWAKLTGTYT